MAEVDTSQLWLKIDQMHLHYIEVKLHSCIQIAVRTSLEQSGVAIIENLNIPPLKLIVGNHLEWAKLGFIQCQNPENENVS